jgi:hypothetical protein
MCVGLRHKTSLPTDLRMSSLRLTKGIVLTIRRADRDVTCPRLHLSSFLGTGWGLSKNFSTREKRRHAHTPHSDTIHVRSPSKCFSTLLSHHVCVNITTHTLC